MIELRPYNELGGAQHGWLDTRHHFSLQIITIQNACTGAIFVSGMMTASLRARAFQRTHTAIWKSSPMCAAVLLLTKTA